MHGRSPEHLIFNFRQRSQALTTLLRFCELVDCILSGSMMTLGGFVETFIFWLFGKAFVLLCGAFFGSAFGMISIFTFDWLVAADEAPVDWYGSSAAGFRPLGVLFLPLAGGRARLRGWMLASDTGWIMWSLLWSPSTSFIDSTSLPASANCWLLI